MSGAFVLRAGRYRIAFIVALVAAIFGGATPVEAAPQRAIAVVVPIVSSTTATGSINAAELDANTAVGGAWRLLADAAITHGASIAVDSRIVASIRRLGDDAPTSAITWLDEVERTNPLYLAWGNADPFALVTAGPRSRISALEVAELADLGASDIVGWPTGRAGDRNSVDRSRSLGFSSLIVDDATFPDAVRALSASASETVAEAVSPVGTRAVVDAVESVIATSPHSFTLPRNPLELDPARAVELFDALSARGVEITRFLPVSTESLGVPVISKPHDGILSALLAQHRFDMRVSQIGADPSLIARPRLERICVLAGLTSDSRFVPTVRTYLRVARTFADVVSVQHGAAYTILSNQADIPITVANVSGTEVTVTVTVRSQTAAMRLPEQSQTVTIGANSKTHVTVPVDIVANGQGALVVSLTNSDGFNITGPVYLPVTIQAQWEGFTLIAFVTFVGVILAVGISRQIRDRRRRA